MGPRWGGAINQTASRALEWAHTSAYNVSGITIRVQEEPVVTVRLQVLSWLTRVFDAERRARVAWVLAQYVEHVAKVEAHRTHR